MDKFIVSARKYRPSTFETLIGQDSIATTLKNSIKRGQLAHAYLFCGPRGVGKTTTARIFAKIINCLNPGENMEPCGECESCKSFDQGRSYCIHELDAASNNSVDDIRALTEKVMIPPQVGKYSVYIIDEVHMLSTSAFNAFLKTLEEPPAHAIFILATTEKHKIIPTILSRCQVYDFNRISVSDIVLNLKYIAKKEEVTIDDSSLHVIAQKADGAMRDALTLFDQVVAFCGNDVKYEDVIKNLNVLDYKYYFTLVENSINGRFADNLVLFDEILSKGFNALYFVGGLSNHLRNLLICKEISSSKLLEVSEDLKAEYTSQSQRCALGFLFKSLAVCEKCEADYVRSNNQRLLVEFMLVRLSQLQQPSVHQASASATEPAPAPQPVAKPATVPQPVAEPATAPQPVAEPATAPQPVAEPIVEHTSEPKAEFTPKPTTEPALEPKAELTPKPTTEPASATKSLSEEHQKPIAEQTPENASEQAPATVSAPTTHPEPVTKPATEPAPVQQPVAEQTSKPATEPAPSPQPVAASPSIKGINSLLNQAQKAQQSQADGEKADALDFMGPSQAKPFTQAQLKEVWLKYADDFEKRQPKLVRFVAALRLTEPLIAEDNTSVIFKVSNLEQKAWIEKFTAANLTNFLRKSLSNNNIQLILEEKTSKEVKSNLYMPSEKDNYMTENNKEFKNLKEDLGAELING